MANMIQITPGVEKHSDLMGRANEDNIEVTLANTNPSGTNTKSTFTISAAGDSAYTTAQLASVVQRIHLFDMSAGNQGLALGTYDRADFTITGSTVAVTADHGATKAIIGVVEFADGNTVPTYAAGY